MSVVRFLLDFFLRANALLIRKLMSSAQGKSKKAKKDLTLFREMGGQVTEIELYLDDLEENAGTASGHYFHQDLLVAQQIYQRNPRRHLDFGGRFDGFVAHVASFRHIEVCDVRQMHMAITNVSFKKLDLLEVEEEMVTDSLSCLHSIEHIGLGRYGDMIDPLGHIKAFQNLSKLLEVGGILYVSFPIAKNSQVVFNKHRIFHPSEIMSWIEDGSNLKLLRFDFVDDLGDLHQNSSVDEAILKNLNYGCGIYTFEKQNLS